MNALATLSSPKNIAERRGKNIAELSVSPAKLESK